MNLPAALISKIELDWREKFGESVIITDIQSCGGGCINQAALVKIGGKAAFLKYNSGVPNDFFQAESIGLEALRKTDTIKVPEVLLTSPESPESPAFLILEALTEGRGMANSAQLFAEDLAALHRSSQENYGFESDNFIGSTAQINTERMSWIEFFRDCRLFPQFNWICQKNEVSQSFKNQFESLLDRLDQLLIPGDAPALLHGDLWSGNSMTIEGGRTAIYDPAVYYGHREADLAMTELFGRLPQSFYEAYDGAYPLEPGFEQRRDLYNLYHMLNHWNLFGGSYRGSCERIIQSYL